MLIQDLNHLEVVNEETNINGGLAIADTFASANAQGFYLATTFTSTYASAFVGFDYWSYQPVSIAYSGSSSSAAAA